MADRGGSVPGLDVRQEQGALWLRLDRPEVLNALSGEMADALAARLEEAAGLDEVRVVVLAGAGGAFSTGADITGAEARAGLDVTALDRANQIIRAIVRLDRPVLAAVDGVAAGVGCSIAIAADVVVAAESASFLLAFARVGLMPDGGATATVAASVGRARAMRMALLAEPLTAREAYDAGLVTHLAADADLPSLVETLVRRLASGPPLALAAAKKAVNAATLPHLEDALERARSGQSALLRTSDAAEGVAAFAARRRPTFRGE